MNKFLNPARRKQNGTVITESVVGLVLISMMLIGGVCFLINSGLCTFYKHKLAFVTIEVARYAASMQSGQDTQSQVASFANKMLNGVGLPDGKVDVEEVSIEGSKAVKVTIQDTPQLLKGVPYLPASITLTDTATAPRPQQKDGFLVFRIVPRTGEQHPLTNMLGQHAPPYQLVYVPICSQPAAGPYFFAGSITPNTGNSTGIAPFDHWNPQNISNKRFLKHIAGIASYGGSNLGPGGVDNRSDCTYIPMPGDAPN